MAAMMYSRLESANINGVDPELCLKLAALEPIVGRPVPCPHQLGWSNGAHSAFSLHQPVERQALTVARAVPSLHFLLLRAALFAIALLEKRLVAHPQLLSARCPLARKHTFGMICDLQSRSSRRALL
jgi:hypothetical protein